MPDAIDTVGQIDLQPTGLVFLDEGMSYDEWAAIGAYLQRAAGSVNWWLGDWLVRGEERYGEKYTQAISETGLSYQTLANMKWVAGKIEFSHRRENLSWKHHSEVAGFEPEERDQWLDAAEEHDYSVAAMKRAIKDARGVAAIEDKSEPFFTGESPREFVADEKEFRILGGQIRPGTAIDLKCGYTHGPLSRREKTIVHAACDHISAFEHEVGSDSHLAGAFRTGLLLGIYVAAPDWGRDLPAIIERYRRL